MKNIKIYHNRKILYFVLAMFFILALLIFYSRNYSNKNNFECITDEDCVLQQVTCCPCNMGGKVECMSKEKARKVEEDLKNCTNNFCIALYNCKKISCKCIEGKCVAK